MDAVSELSYHFARASMRFRQANVALDQVVFKGDFSAIGLEFDVAFAAGDTDIVLVLVSRCGALEVEQRYGIVG